MENRFTKTKFDTASSVSIAEGTRLTARIYCSGRAYKAELVWKSGWERTEKVITAFDEASMRRAILTRDPTARFLGKVDPNTVPVETLADKNADMLEAMRLDTANVSDRAYISACQRLRVKPQPRNAPSNIAQAIKTAPFLTAAETRMLEQLRVDIVGTSDVAYRNAAKKFGQQPQPRPTQAATPTSQTLVPFHIQGEAYGAFMQAHFELFNGVFAEQNATIIARWMQDENRQCDTASLEQCYRECFAAGYFRDARTLARGMNGDIRIVREYNHAELVAMRRQRVADVANQPPAGLSAVDVEAWQAVRSAYPNLSVNSNAFKQCVRNTLQKWAREYVLEQNPALGATNAKGQLAHAGELQAAVDRVLVQWVRAGNPNLRIGPGSNKSGDSRIWLG